MGTHLQKVDDAARWEGASAVSEYVRCARAGLAALRWKNRGTVSPVAFAHRSFGDMHVQLGGSSRERSPSSSPFLFARVSDG